MNTRRQFLHQSMAIAGTLAIPGTLRSQPASRCIRLGVLGLGGRGINLAKMFAREPDVEITWLCDPDSRRAARALAAFEPAPGRSPEFAQDFRRVLDDREVDALVIATPDHWHGLATVLACQTGKDVYVEKPLSHNAREGRQMVAAARKYQRVVQVGIQSRSAPYVHAAREYLRSGQLGEIRLVRVYNLMEHPLTPLGPAGAVPAGFDYDLWCGPAALLPYHPDRRWLNYAEFSCGPIPGDAVHQLDLARFLLEDPAAPRVVSHQGGIDVLRDGRDTPDTQVATFDYGPVRLHFEGALWMPYMKKTDMAVRDRDTFPNWPFSSTKLEVFGTRGLMLLGRHGGGWQVFDANQQPIAARHGRQADQLHLRNFLDCIRTRELPVADVAQGHASTLLCHLANAAWRAGNRTLRFDPQTETFPEDPAANEFLGRTYRAPWRFSDPV
ncbi:MAG: Gfo/Idh/MocA family oxidoreductase [Verrucomicrobia bacterium]|nr:Gfo/Idh/MocA family oxidoreductase [Verrucomicrobiota bacterium]